MTDQATFTRTLAGRDIQFKMPLAGQLIMLRRRVLRRQQDAQNTDDDSILIRVSSDMIVDTLNVVESLIVNREDAEFLEQAMLTGEVGYDEVMDVLRLEQEEKQPQKRTPAKAAKTVASRARTKR